MKEFENKKVSIILPVFNQEKYLEKCLNSLINQSYQNIEIIVVDDGSTDSSLSIMNKMASFDSRIKVFSKTNEGVVTTIFRGANKASGEFACFVDPDDYVGEDYIKTFVDQIGDYDFIAMGFFLDDGNTITSKELVRDKVFDKTSLAEITSYFPLAKNGLYANDDIYDARWNKMYKTPVLLAIVSDYQNCAKSTLGEDALFNLFLLHYSNSGIAVKKSNSYFYNVANISSAMGDYKKCVKKVEQSKVAYDYYNHYCDCFSCNTGQANALFYLLCRALVGNAKKGEKEYLTLLLSYLKKDALYRISYKFVKNKAGLKERLNNFLLFHLSPSLLCIILLKKRKTK